MREPNFIIAGGVATGTSFLSHSIKDHPEIYLPKVMRPECGFFYKSWEYEKGKNYYLQRWFSEASDERAVGERSSLYIHGLFNKVAKRIHSMYPDMKFIFCLRNPTERAYRNYRFTALCGLETLSFKDALKNEEDRKKSYTGFMAEIQPTLYKERGCYYDQLEPFLEYFPQNNILCIKSEILSKNTDEEIKRVFKFLGVNEKFKTLPQKDHTSPNVKNLYVQMILRKTIGKRLDNITEEYRQENVASLISKIVGFNLTKTKMPMGNDERRFLNDYYAQRNEKLAKLLGWDLSDWK